MTDYNKIQYNYQYYKASDALDNQLLKSDHKDKLFEVRAEDPNQKIPLATFNNPEDLESIDGGSVNGNRIERSSIKTDVKLVIVDLEEKLADMPGGSAKFLNNEPSCVIQGLEHDILNNLKIMSFAQIHSLSGSRSDDDRKILNAFYQKKVSDILSISQLLTKMKVDTRQCDDYSFQKIKSVLNMKLDIKEEIANVKAVINDEFSKHTCNSNFQASVAETIANTNIESIQGASDAAKALEDATQSAFTGVILTNEQNNLAFDNPDYCSNNDEL